MKKIFFSSATVFLIAFVLSGVYAQEALYTSVLLKGGHVIDPANNISKIMDVLVRDGKIASVDSNISESNAEKVVDVSGYYVTPGLIDIHAHVFHTSLPLLNQRFSVIADDICFPSGVTTVVDVGTSGAKDFVNFKKLIDISKTRILVMLNIAASGMYVGEDYPLDFDVKLSVETARQYPDIIVGFKTAHYLGKPYGLLMPFNKFQTPWASVDSVLAAGRLAGLPCMFDVWPRPAEGGFPARSLRELILEKMRPGDILTHCFHNMNLAINADGKVNPDVIKAQKRGVIFDVGHGGGSFVWKNAVPAFRQGFYPNAISTDLHAGNTSGPAINMIHVMSKFLCIGMSLEDVIRLSTSAPAQIINRTELGNLSVGSTADIAVIEMLNGNFGYTDVKKARLKGDKKLQCVMTLFGGSIVFNPSGLSYPDWEDIPRDDEYWARPAQDW
ncbi:MAG: amidohydrolase/deacetylase family metallohydrolase [Candidatus Latescibacteria bacterium]|nr:amidohydrolase/deacetylase family metallohydrolase [Candidatus Latescibacterota bacterium]